MNSRFGNAIASQRGAVLPVTLFILVIVTLLAVSSMDTTSSGMRIAQNQQAQLQAHLVAEQQIEKILSDSGWFKTGAGGYQDLEDDDGANDDVFTTTLNNFTVQVSKPSCFGSEPVTGYSAQATLVPETDYWEFSVAVVDPLTGARITAHQGVRMRMLAGSCTTL